MGAGGPQGSGRTNAGGHKKRSAPRVVHGGGPYGGGSTPSPRRRQQTSRAVARTPVKRYVRPKQRVSSHTKEHVKPQRKRITEDSPKWDAKTMGNKSGLRKQDGKLYLHGHVIQPNFPITSMKGLRKFYTDILSAPERSFKYRTSQPKMGGAIGNKLRNPNEYGVGAAVGGASQDLALKKNLKTLKKYRRLEGEGKLNFSWERKSWKKS